ncbi:DNA excision repair protein ERCC-1 [Chionoecetes opilio]|uniref:DNA excision repair protein ERCC-1 n=1 Tax=Chionoecetes opilio TaxID=41210 RepID=A0A8J5C7I1_CHIOP|nr:DNA excision repair protein ERCC-1 [Chionoecetes opilio]
MSSNPDEDVQEASTSTGGNYIKSGFIDVTNRQQGKDGSSAFSKAFTNLKKSEFYEETAPEAKTAATEPKQKPLNKPASKYAVVVNPKQRGNPILKFVRNVPWEYGEIVPDYEMGVTTCALFLSIRYHNLNPNYIHERLKQLGHQYQLRVLLVQVDVKEPHHELKQLTKICFLADLTLMLAWSQEEAGRIIEIYKIYENKPPDMIMEKQDSNPHSMVLVMALEALHEEAKPLGLEVSWPKTKGQVFGGLLDETVQSVHVCSEDIEILESFPW